MKVEKINRIHYIVQENPKGVARMLREAGYSPSGNLAGLIEQTKGYVRRDGDQAIVKLLQNHPERKAILATIKDGYDQFGGCGCSSFDGNCGCQSSYLGAMERPQSGLKRKKWPRQAYRQPIYEEQNEEPLEEELDEIEQADRSGKLKRKKKAKQNRVEGGYDRPSAPRGLFTVHAKDLAIGSFFFGILIITSQVKS